MGQTLTPSMVGDRNAYSLSKGCGESDFVASLEMNVKSRKAQAAETQPPRDFAGGGTHCHDACSPSGLALSSLTAFSSLRSFYLIRFDDNIF